MCVSAPSGQVCDLQSVKMSDGLKIFRSLFNKRGPIHKILTRPLMTIKFCNLLWSNTGKELGCIAKLSKNQQYFIFNILHNKEGWIVSCGLSAYCWGRTLSKNQKINIGLPINEQSILNVYTYFEVSLNNFPF